MNVKAINYGQQAEMTAGALAGSLVEGNAAELEFQAYFLWWPGGPQVLIIVDCNACECTKKALLIAILSEYLTGILSYMLGHYM